MASDGGDGGLLLAIGTAVLLTVLITFYSKRNRVYQVPARDVSKGHRWFYPDLPAMPVYCNVCELLVSDAGQCDSCGIFADHPCMKPADQKLLCKPLTWLGPATKHHWVKGNLPPDSSCAVCSRECGHEDGPSDFRCCWCRRTIHTECRDGGDDTCDLGEYRDCVVPPNCVKLKLVGWKGRRRFVVGEVKHPPSANWRPVIVVANRKSGNNDGQKILQAFRGILNPVQVIDLHELPLEGALAWCHLVSSNACRILVGGGDGTVGWVLDTIDRLGIQPSPQVAILPLGTGNDLSRVLGWGEGTSGDVDVRDVMERLASASTVHLDRWKVAIRPVSHIRIRMPTRTVFMNNYASVGVDALVTLKFHQTRESKIYLYGSRLLNKFLFMGFATKDVWERECKNLREKVSLWLDGTRIDLPDIEAIVVLNIPSWGAGVQPWQLGSSAHLAPKQEIDDNLVEVFGVYSTFHIAQMQVGLSEPVRLGQAREVKMILTDKVPMQIDGEPWEQGAGQIVLSFHCQATMLACSK